MTYGELGLHPVDGPGEPPCYGLYIELNGHAVFVDLRKDKLLEERKKRALELFENTARLQAALSLFLDRNPGYKTRELAFIGLHAKDLKQGEVFWGPDGYTLLKDFEFVEG